MIGFVFSFLNLFSTRFLLNFIFHGENVELTKNLVIKKEKNK